jgi:predicted anti-sigma-YlaC factor YlaD
MDCERVQELLLESLTGSVAEDDARAVASHREGCAACREAAAEFSALWSDLSAMPHLMPSPALRARFYAILEGEQRAVASRAAATEIAPAGRRAAPSAGLGASFSEWLSRWWPRRPAIQFAVAAACLVLGIFGGNLLSDRAARDAEITRLQQEVASTRQMVALSLLQQPTASGRLQGVDWTYRVGTGNVEISTALLRTLDEDSSIHVRLAAADALRQYLAAPEVRQGLVATLPRQSSPLVQIAVIDLLVASRDRESAGALQKLVDDELLNQDVRQRAKRRQYSSERNPCDDMKRPLGLARCSRRRS